VGSSHTKEDNHGEEEKGQEENQVLSLGFFPKRPSGASSKRPD
jgi:hypothetical protein